MPWVKIDDAFFDHPKLRAVGRDGRALAIAALCHSSAQYLDGVIGAADLPLVAAKAEVRRSVAAKLVEADLWHQEGHSCPRCNPCPPGAYLIHDYHAYQPSAEQERKRRREVSEVKSRAGRMGAAARWGNGKPDGAPMADPMANGWHSDDPDPEPPLVTTSNRSGVVPSPVPSTPDDVVVEFGQRPAALTIDPEQVERIRALKQGRSPA